MEHSGQPRTLRTGQDMTWLGEDKPCQTTTGRDQIRQEKTGQDRTGHRTQDRTRHSNPNRTARGIQDQIEEKRTEQRERALRTEQKKTEQDMI